jgi:hypothetical protein
MPLTGPRPPARLVSAPPIVTGCTLVLECAPGRNRTYDRQIRRLLLYPLSYGGLGAPSLPYGQLADHCSAGSCAE